MHDIPYETPLESVVLPLRQEATVHMIDAEQD